MAGASRPLSPHLSIYRFKMTMAMSIAHRITGAGLYFGMVLVAWWLMAVATGGAFYETTAAIFGSIFGRIVIFLASFALIHHALGGIRFLIADAGAGMGKPARDMLATAVPIGSVVLTVLMWIVILVKG